MRLPLQSPRALSHWGWNGPEWIGVGVTILLFNCLWPTVPVMTAMSLVAQGATAITVDRYRGKWLGQIVVASNLVMYCGLYALFFGASMHHALSHGDHRLCFFAAIDLAVSIFPLAMAIVTSYKALREYEPTN